MSTLVRLKPKRIEIPGKQLEYVGPYGLVTVRQMPLITVGSGWYEDLRIVGPNGRRRNAITIPGTNRWVKPPNTGKTPTGTVYLVPQRNRGRVASTTGPTASGTGVRMQRKPKACAHCGAEFTPSRPERYEAQRYCSRSCGVRAAHAHNRANVTPWQERFWGFVPDPRPDGCWEWTGGRKDGYGILMTTKGHTMAAHRASVIISGRAIPDGLKVCHTCDNPPCVNPAHLFVDTQAANVADMMRKGRSARVEGEASNLGRFPREVIDEVLRLKATTGLSNRAIGERVGMSKAHVRRIVNGETRRIA